jgi:hypothetical protein
MSEPSLEFDPIDDLADAFLERYRRGERPSLSEYADRHPELAERIRAVFPALVAIEEIGQPLPRSRRRLHRANDRSFRTNPRLSMFAA